MVIPTYNNRNTLKKVLQGLLKYTRNLIVINDGSTDGSGEILQEIKELTVLEFPVNKGKGAALRAGFEKAQAMGYTYAISIDSDGQLFPDDLPVFLEALKNRTGELLVIGSRNMEAPGVPEKSTVGNRFSTFWFWVETGIKLRDTQCGYRLYPLKVVNSLHLCTTGYELEIEVLVKAAWKGVEIINLPVKVLYDPMERVTHFRPFQDVARITALNIGFLGMAFFYIWPRNIIRKIRKKLTLA